jgi:hypothetical protein
MDYLTIRDCNRLQRNANRMAKAAKLVRAAMKTNEVSDLDLGLCADKLEKACRDMSAMRDRIMKKA